MAKRGRNDQMVKAREEQAWSLRAQGQDHATIARSLGVERSTVTKLLARVARRRLRQLPKKVDEHRTCTDAQLDYLLAEALDCWRLSRGVGLSREGDAFAPSIS